MKTAGPPARRLERAEAGRRAPSADARNRWPPTDPLAAMSAESVFTAPHAAVASASAAGASGAGAPGPDGSFISGAPQPAQHNAQRRASTEAARTTAHETHETTKPTKLTSLTNTETHEAHETHETHKAHETHETRADARSSRNSRTHETHKTVRTDLISCLRGFRGVRGKSLCRSAFVLSWQLYFLGSFCFAARIFRSDADLSIERPPSPLSARLNAAIASSYRPSLNSTSPVVSWMTELVRSYPRRAAGCLRGDRACRT